MTQKLLFIVNPKAGKGKIKPKLADVIDLFNKYGYDVTVYMTQSQGDAKRVAALRYNEFDLIVCSGGDGTLSEVVGGLIDCSGPKPAIGYIPMGTTNDFARTLGIPTTNILKAADLAVRGPAYPCDVGRFNDRSFTYTAAFGAFSDVSYATPQSTKSILGHAAYVLQGLESMPSIKSYLCTVTIGNRTITDWFIFGAISNSESIGGFKGLCGMDVELSDGLFEVLLIKHPNTLAELHGIARAILAHDMTAKGIVACRTASIEVACEEPLAWTLDGEYGGTVNEAKISVDKKAIRYVTRMGKRG